MCSAQVLFASVRVQLSTHTLSLPSTHERERITHTSATHTTPPMQLDGRVEYQVRRPVQCSLFSGGPLSAAPSATRPTSTRIIPQSCSSTGASSACAVSAVIGAIRPPRRAAAENSLPPAGARLGACEDAPSAASNGHTHTADTHTAVAVNGNRRHSNRRSSASQRSMTPRSVMADTQLAGKSKRCLAIEAQDSSSAVHQWLRDCASNDEEVDAAEWHMESFSEIEMQSSSELEMPLVPGPCPLVFYPLSFVCVVCVCVCVRVCACV